MQTTQNAEAGTATKVSRTTRITKATRAGWFYDRMIALGLSYSEADQLRRIEMTISRWNELECGNGNDYASWAIERDEETGKPYMVRHIYAHGNGKDRTIKTPIADREKGALKRAAAILANHPDLWMYHQGDPRGAALYVGRIADIREGERLDSVYTRGVAVCIN